MTNKSSRELSAFGDAPAGNGNSILAPEQVERGSRVHGSLGAILAAVAERLRRESSDYEGFLPAFTALEQRLNTGAFHLAVLGQFKRGKSTLLNALLGESLLPTGVVPLTAIPTFLRKSDHGVRAARVHFLDEKVEDYRAQTPVNSPNI